MRYFDKYNNDMTNTYKLIRIVLQYIFECEGVRMIRAFDRTYRASIPVREGIESTRN